MKIGMIAMSGIRAADEELMALGLTLPGVVERSRVVASLPSLGLLTLAGLTPPEIDVQYLEIEDIRKEPALPGDFDLVAIASFTAQIRDAYRVADVYRERGTPVVMGGLHVTKMPGEAARHATTVAIGEGELLWPTIVDDWRNGRLRRRYEQPAGVWFDLADAPMPRFELLDAPRYNRFTVQTSRGCPHQCEFCASSILLTPGYSVKPVEKVIAEIRRIKQIMPSPFVEFADDNSFSQRGHYKRLLAALRDERIGWFTEADISIAEDAELLDLMRESGCRQVLIGLESPGADGLDGIELRGNWKLRVQSRYEDAVRTIQSRGITVNGCFILGLDGHTSATFDAIYDFIDRTNLFEAQLTVLTPFPGTPLYERLKRDGRLLEAEAWHRCTLFDVNFVPQGMSPSELRSGLIELARRVYEPAFVQSRRERFFEQLAPDARRRRALREDSPQ
ncbi:MAG: radical SAM protein [Phycisphaerae bacterium]